MERLFSAYGVEAFSDHNEVGETDTTVVNDCIVQAKEEIDRFALMRYSETGLASSSLINRWATTLATYFLCLRRGNPIIDSLKSEFDRIMEVLEKVATGATGGILPGVPLRGDLRPSMSNLQVDRRYRHSTIRVTRANSTDAPTVLTQDHLNEPPVLYD